MSDPIETTIEAVRESNVIAKPSTGDFVVLGLAVYGGIDLTRRTVSKVKQIRINRKAKKVVKEQQTDPQS